MELVDGGTLDDILQRRGRLSWEQVIEHGLQKCSALQYAHDRGIVHRDVKPGNFLVTTSGQLKLSDFGLASIAAARKITAAGKTMGTYRYMAPEQIRGKTVTPKTDLYALGCVLFEMLAGRPPFLGDTPAEILQKHLKEAPPRVSEFAPDCPPALERLIADLLAKDAADRPADASAVAKSLKGVTMTVVVEAPRRTGGITNRPTGTVTPSETHASPVPAETASVETVSTSPAVVWLLPSLIVVAGLLLAWNIKLAGDQRQLHMAEELWAEAFTTETTNFPVRIGAARALGQLGTRPDLLVQALKEPDYQIREAAAEGLGEMGHAAVDTIPALMKVQKEDEFPGPRRAAGEAIARIRNAEPRRSYATYVVIGSILVATAVLAWLTTGSRLFARMLRD